MFTKVDATGITDALQKVHDWVRASGWTVLRFSAGDELWMSNTGNGPNRNVFVGMQVSKDPAQAIYGFRIRAAVSFSADKAFDLQDSVSPVTCWNIWDSPMTLWMYANTRRIILVAKISTSYTSAYMGMFLPFALPDEYPFPLYVGGNYSEIAASDIDNSANRFIADPGAGTSYYFMRDANKWQEVQNHVDQARAGGKHTESTTVASLWPTNTPGTYEYWQPWKGLRPDVNGNLPVVPLHIIDRGNGEMVGVLDGVYSTSGFTRSSEQEARSNGVKYRLFQNVFRSGESDFMAIEER